MDRRQARTGRRSSSRVVPLSHRLTKVNYFEPSLSVAVAVGVLFFLAVVVPSQKGEDVAERFASSDRRVEIEPFGTLHANKGILFPVDEGSLVLCPISVEISGVVISKTEVNEANEGVGGGDEEHAVEHVVSEGVDRAITVLTHSPAIFGSPSM